MTTRYFVSLLTAVLCCFCAAAGGQSSTPIVVGAVISQSGPHARLAAGYRDGLLLWQEEVNAGGGLLGRKVELRILDDGSEAVRAGALYVQLISQDKADLLIGPYGTAATVMGAAEAESARRVMINGAGPSRAVHKRSPRYVFQSAVPYSAYGPGILQVAREEGFTRLFIIARDEPAAREMADATRLAADKLGFAAGEVAVHGPGVVDFTPQVLKARALEAQAWLAFGEVQDAAEMLKSLKKQGYAPGLFFALGAADAAVIRPIGQDAEYALGARDYDARLATPANARFVKGFTAKYSGRPGAAAAQGYAAGTVLAEGVKRAGAMDQEKLRAALASLEIETVLGAHRVDPLTGEQKAITASVTQIQKGQVELVWPVALQTAKREPYPPWSGRKLLKK